MAGREMIDADGVFTQLYEHLRLPDYFGWNWDALRDCLQDLSWLTASHFLLIIDDAEFVLSGSGDEYQIFYRALLDAAKYWAAKPELPGQAGVSFRVVLLCSPQASSGLNADVRSLGG
ncbi:barstar family protein [Streptomyces sp. MMG1533]|uniref:barstar family protein n=1 Tax=Streptomyces sp. MMG1533 TaxID=1415546 RepID=UPI00099DFEFE|nr:barstar family protein [Streptomyces sp. MMG1533]